jgi:8-oxo-dGTP pyrophosphatase MutT (NUDIX family)
MRFFNQPIGDVLAAQVPKRINNVDARRAAVALILSADEISRDATPSMLLIKRASHPDDPWSGHLAFPGGRHEADDANLVTTAQRETLEEVGVDLYSHANTQLLGQLDDLSGRARGKPVDLVISCYVFAATTRPHITPNYEVADHYWLSLSACCDSERQVRHYPRGHEGEHYAGIRVDHSGEDILWGLTYRFTCNFFAKFGVNLP